MRRMWLLFIMLFCLLVFEKVCSQTHTIDSLKHEIFIADNNAVKLNTIFSLCKKRHSLSTDTLYKYASLAKSLSGAAHNSHDIILSDYYFVNYLIKKGKIDSALSISNYYISLLKNNKNEKQLYLNFVATKGALLIKSDHYKESFATYYTLLNESQTAHDTLNELLAETGMGWVNMEMDKNAEAISFFKAALQYPAASDLERYGEYISFIYADIASAYNSIGKNDSAEYFINKAIPLAEKFENLTSLANSLAIKADIMSATKRNKQAEDALIQVVAIRKQIGDPFFIVSDMSQLAVYYYHNNEPQKGIAASLEGIKIAEQNGLTSKLPLLYDALAQNYNVAGDYKMYGETLKKIITLKDSLYEKNSANALAEIEGKYEVQKKENIITNQKLAIIKKNYLLFGSLMLLLLLITSAFLLFKIYRKKQELKLSFLMKEEKRLSHEAIIHAEEKERKRIAADLHDNMGAYATAIIANVDDMIVNKKNAGESAFTNLKINAIELMSNLRDTIWASNKERILLTGISDRFKNYIRKVVSTYPNVNVEITESIVNDVSFSPVHALNIFRIIQEACTNALKHSACSVIHIDFKSDRILQITICDNGSGFADDNYARNGNGIKNMKARAQDSGLLLCIEKSENGGTAINLSGQSILHT